MIELERTYLLKYIPEMLKDCESKEVIDIYIPKTSEHPTLRIRKNGDKYEMTKKEPIEEGDSSRQKEQTIILTEEEFQMLEKLDGKKVHKTRYYYNHWGRIAEVGIFQGPLKGLILVDFEFLTIEEKDSFEMPEFCLVEITQEDFTAGGKICGKSYEDIEENLGRFEYKKLFLE
ncbi:MAG: hypothetical protein IIA85_02555 [Nanoarchaeota archaeon]|nr:hypothetical protein [Nanoarchaeota archaeon]